MIDFLIHLDFEGRMRLLLIICLFLPMFVAIIIFYILKFVKKVQGKTISEEKDYENFSC